MAAARAASATTGDEERARVGAAGKTTRRVVAALLTATTRDDKTTRWGRSGVVAVWQSGPQWPRLTDLFDELCAFYCVPYPSPNHTSPSLSDARAIVPLGRMPRGTTSSFKSSDLIHCNGKQINYTPLLRISNPYTWLPVQVHVNLRPHRPYRHQPKRRRRRCLSSLSIVARRIRDRSTPRPMGNFRLLQHPISAPTPQSSSQRVQNFKHPPPRRYC